MPQPFACRVNRVPDDAKASPFAVPWSTRMRTDRHWVGAEALGNEIENWRHLLVRDVKRSMPSTSRSNWTRRQPTNARSAEMRIVIRTQD